ncbi:MAG: zf-TFIIB domain-containing protein [Flavisolibacter sp.]
MKCPNCNETLLMTERNQIEIDYCLRAEVYGWTKVNWIKCLNTLHKIFRRNKEKINMFLHLTNTGSNTESTRPIIINLIKRNLSWATCLILINRHSTQFFTNL